MIFQYLTTEKQVIFFFELRKFRTEVGDNIMMNNGFSYSINVRVYFILRNKIHQKATNANNPNFNEIKKFRWKPNNAEFYV